MSLPVGKSALTENLAGALDIMLGRTSGVARIDLTANGVWKSIFGLILAGLIDMSALSILYEFQALKTDMGSGKAFYIFGQILIALVSYAASLIALYILCRTPSEQQKFPTALVVHNWAAPLVSIAFLPLLIIAVWLGGNTLAAGENILLNLFSVFWVGVLIFVGLRLLRISLDLPLSKSVAFFVITTAVSLVTTEALESLLGFARPS